jgi:hypothetical protein
MYSLIQYPRVKQVTAQMCHTAAQASNLFHEALRDPSNLELDWLWLATQVTRAGEQADCLQQALRINPRSALARRGLAQLRQRPGAPIDFRAWAQYVFADR